MALTTEDQVAIQQLYARYNHAIDSGKADVWAACFTADGTFDSGQGTFKGTEALTGFANGFHGQMKGNARHWTNNIMVDADGAGAKGTCYLQLYMRQDGKSNMIVSGIYNDTLVKSGPEWKFTSRAVKGDS
jgi:SnoaL-like domain